MSPLCLPHCPPSASLPSVQKQLSRLRCGTSGWSGATGKSVLELACTHNSCIHVAKSQAVGVTCHFVLHPSQSSIWHKLKQLNKSHEWFVCAAALYHQRSLYCTNVFVFWGNDAWVQNGAAVYRLAFIHNLWLAEATHRLHTHDTWPANQKRCSIRLFPIWKQVLITQIDNAWTWRCSYIPDIWSNSPPPYIFYALLFLACLQLTQKRPLWSFQDRIPSPWWKTLTPVGRLQNVDSPHTNHSFFAIFFVLPPSCVKYCRFNLTLG